MVYYTGSDDAYDYFHLDVLADFDKSVKVPQTETQVFNRFPVTTREEAWVVYDPILLVVPAE